MTTSNTPLTDAKRSKENGFTYEEAISWAEELEMALTERTKERDQQERFKWAANKRADTAELNANRYLFLRDEGSYYEGPAIMGYKQSDWGDWYWDTLFAEDADQAIDEAMKVLQKT